MSDKYQKSDHHHHNRSIKTKNSSITNSSSRSSTPPSPQQQSKPTIHAASSSSDKKSSSSPFRRVMSIKHGDKIFVAIFLFICVEISTFSRLYLNLSPSTSYYLYSSVSSSVVGSKKSSSKNDIPGGGESQHQVLVREETAAGAASRIQKPVTKLPKPKRIKTSAPDQAAPHETPKDDVPYHDATARSPRTDMTQRLNLQYASLKPQQQSSQMRTSDSDQYYPRVIFFEEQDADKDDVSTSNEKQRKTRTVEAMGDLDCCTKDPFGYIKPEEKEFYEECTPMADWQTKIYPTCNMIHELPLIEDEDEYERVGGIGNDRQNTKNQMNTTTNRTSHHEPTVTLINTKGSWRSVWKVTQQLHTKKGNMETTTIPKGEDPESIVLKTLRYDREFDHESYQLQNIDSMAMERLTSSPYIANEYGFCGQSVLTEFAPQSGRDLIKNKRLHTWQRLEIAHDLAAALADMHSIDYPHATNATFTHNDINIANTIQGRNGRIKFNDFNIGVLMRWNPRDNKPCGYPVRFAAPLWRSPEDIHETNTSRYIQPDKSDTYALGNLLFQVLTTHQPWTWLEPNGKLEVEQVIEKKLAGELPFIPTKFQGISNNKTGIQAIYHATLACFAHDPNDRPTSFELAQALETALEWTKTGVSKTADDVRQLFNFTTNHNDGMGNIGTNIGSRRRTTATTSTANLKTARSTPTNRFQHHGNHSSGIRPASLTNTANSTNVTPRRPFGGGVSNKTIELLREKNRQVEAAAAAKRNVARRQVPKPKIRLGSPPVTKATATRPSLLRGNRPVVIVESTTDDLKASSTSLL